MGGREREGEGGKDGGRMRDQRERRHDGRRKRQGGCKHNNLRPTTTQHTPHPNTHKHTHTHHSFHRFTPLSSITAITTPQTPVRSAYTFLFAGCLETSLLTGQHTDGHWTHCTWQHGVRCVQGPW